MTIVAFDTLVYANKLKSAGVNSIEAEAQAEALSDVMREYIQNQLSTKQDLKNTETKLREEIKAIEMRLYVFMVKTTIFTVTILGGLQTLFKFVHA